MAQTLLFLRGAAARIPENLQAANSRARRDRRARHYYELRQTCGVGTGAGGAEAGVCGSDLRLGPRRFAFRMMAKDSGSLAGDSRVSCKGLRIAARKRPSEVRGDLVSCQD